jgi:hypothetical protein
MPINASNEEGSPVLADAAACAERAACALAHLSETGGARPDSTDGANLRHEVRNRLGTLRAALDVLDLVPAQSTLAAEAREIAQRHALELDKHLNELALEQTWPMR